MKADSRVWQIIRWISFIPVSLMIAGICALLIRLLFSYQNEIAFEFTQIFHGVLVQVIFLYFVFKLAPSNGFLILKMFFFLRTSFSILILCLIVMGGQWTSSYTFDMASEGLVFLGSVLLIRKLGMDLPGAVDEREADSLEPDNYEMIGDTLTLEDLEQLSSELGDYDRHMIRETYPEMTDELIDALPRAERDALLDKIYGLDIAPDILAKEETDQ